MQSVYFSQWYPKAWLYFRFSAVRLQLVYISSELFGFCQKKNTTANLINQAQVLLRERCTWLWIV